MDEELVDVNYNNIVQEVMVYVHKTHNYCEVTQQIYGHKLKSCVTRSSHSSSRDMCNTQQSLQQ